MYKEKKVGLAIITYERPEFCSRTFESAYSNLKDIVDVWVISDDGSNPESITKVISDIIKISSEVIFLPGEHKSIAANKNRALKMLMSLNCDYIFLCEDDMEIISPQAVSGYIDESIRTGVEHMSFAHHGSNVDMGKSGDWLGLELYSACVGAWSFFTRNAIEVAGGFDERLVNAYEHAEHTSRISKARLTHPFWSFPDVVGSKNWIRPQNNAIESSKLREDGPAWIRNNEQMLQLWREIDPEVWK